MWSRLQLKVRTKTPAFPPTRSFTEVPSQVFQCPPPVNSWKLSLPVSAHLSCGIQKLLVVSDSCSSHSGWVQEAQSENVKSGVLHMEVQRATPVYSQVFPEVGGEP